MINQFTKNRPGNICHGLKYTELDCNCTNEQCISTLVSDRLVRAYEVFRYLLDTPIYPTCGYRCIIHNFQLGSDLSRHKTGEAIDISAINLLDKLSVDKILHFAKIAGFTYYIYYPNRNIFHLDVRAQGGNL